MKNKKFLQDSAELLHSDDRRFAVGAESEPQHEIMDPPAEKKVTKATEKTGHFFYYVLAVSGAITLILTLLYSITFLPRFGNTDSNPTVNDIYEEYIENGTEKTGTTNFVTGMILDYRAFDTLGESFVLYTAVTCVLILLQGFQNHMKKDSYRPKHDKVLRDGCSLLVPLILMLGAYVILGGSISPGGGFSGGAIIGAGLVLYAVVFGFDQSERFFRDKNFKIISAIALLTYCASKTYSFLTGAMHIESVIPLGIAGTILSGGLVFVLNLCVGVVVSCTMFGFYSLFCKGDI